MTTAAMSDQQVERIAWTVLVCAFVGFLIVLVGAPSFGYWFISNATDSHETALTVLSGTAIVEVAGRDPSGEQKQRMLPEGATIRTDANTRVELTLFDGSSVIVFPDTQVTLGAARSPKFAFSQQPLQDSLILQTGRVRLSVSPDEPHVEFHVDTPHGSTQFVAGSYSVEVTRDQSEVVVRSGQALVSAHAESLPLKPRERGQLRLGEKPRGPLPAQRDLIANGAFQSLNDWRAYNDQGGDGGGVDGDIELVNDAGRRAVHIVRRGSNGNHDDAGIEQVLNKDVTDAEAVRLHMDVRVSAQSLSGCGYLSTECPLMVRIKYRDIKGGENFWVHGFFAQNVDGKAINNGEQVPQGLWYPYESQDLTDILIPKPAQIISVQIFASGWDFESMVADVGLIVE